MIGEPIGNTIIKEVQDHFVNGVKYHRVFTEDGKECILSVKDLEKQIAYAKIKSGSHVGGIGLGVARKGKVSGKKNRNSLGGAGKRKKTAGKSKPRH